MTLRLIFLATVSAAIAEPLIAQSQSNPSILASALDRCMATYAVRLTRADASDEAIYAAATAGCKPIEDELTIVVRRDLPKAQAEAALQQWATQAKPNFLTLLARIRADRAAAAGAPPLPGNSEGCSAALTQREQSIHAAQEEFGRTKAGRKYIKLAVRQKVEASKRPSTELTKLNSDIEAAQRRYSTDTSNYACEPN